jgi:outer membrane murein-binding lipoprotein Lpp
MHSRVRVIFGLCAAMVVSLFLSGCATLNKNECQTVDWEQLGLQNGQAGEPQSYIAEHQKACSQYKLPVDTAKWDAGWQKGIRNYCTPANGLAAGQRGRTDGSMCPSDQMQQFSYYAQIGGRVYSAQSDVDGARSELEQISNDIKTEQDRGRRAELWRRRDEVRMRLQDAQDALYVAKRQADDAYADLMRKGPPKP